MNYLVQVDKKLGYQLNNMRIEEVAQNINEIAITDIKSHFINIYTSPSKENLSLDVDMIINSKPTSAINFDLFFLTLKRYLPKQYKYVSIVNFSNYINIMYCIK